MLYFNSFARISRSIISSCAVAAFFCAAACLVETSNAQESVEPQESATFIEELGLIEDSTRMMSRALRSEIDAAGEQWVEDYEKVKTDEDVKNYQEARLKAFREALGPMWERTPLNVQITGSGVKEKFRYENVIFESQPGVYVTALMTLPLEERYPGPYPAMLVLCGHSTNGKEYENYQGIGILAAVNGIAALVMDPIDQGERFQYTKEDGTPNLVGTSAHNLVQAGSILVGRNTATFEVWDAMRAIDYLQSRDDIIKDKIGVCGTSGGGTQTSYIMNLDERVTLAAPSCYICSFFGDLSHNLGPQDGEQNIWGQLKFGMDHADYLFLRAPMPVLMCGATRDFFFIEDGWRSYRYAARIYSRLGYQNRLSIVEKDDEHGYADIAQVGTIRWARLWFMGLNDEITDTNEPPLTTEEVNSVKDGVGIQALPNLRTSRDLNLDLAKELEPARKAKWNDISPEAAAALVRARAVVRSDEEAPSVKVVGAREGDFGVERVFGTDPSIWLTARENFGADEKFESMTLAISDKGRGSEATNAVFANAGDAKVAAVELRGYGDTQEVGRTYYNHSMFGTDGSENCFAYLLGKTYVGLRVDDLLALVRFYREERGVEEISLVAEGYAGTVALIAAIAEPDAFASVKLVGDLPTWTTQLGREYGPIPLTNTIHGVLNDFDIDDLQGYLATQGVLFD
ncbi:MAG: acetylxylan esterase [Thermoguttaceae bacterium]|jgi:dienelactone hydrolase